MTKDVWITCELSTLKRKLHGLGKGHFVKRAAHTLLCKIEQELKEERIFSIKLHENK